MQKISLGVESLNKPWENLKMCELGAQRIVKKTVSKVDEWYGFTYSKEFFESKEVEHISLDINNKWGSLYIDLSVIQDKWHGYFDILTDYGTSEHVKNGQYEVFANAHNFIREGGVMCHCTPVVGRIQMGHPVRESVYYHEDFYEKLAKLNSYEIIDMEIMRDDRARKKQGGDLTCVLRKTQDNVFCTKKDFWELNAIDDYSKNMSLTKERFNFIEK